MTENRSSSTIEENVCKAALNPHMCESSSGSDPTGSGLSGEEQGSAHCAGELVTAAGGDACGRSVSSSKQVARSFVPRKKKVKEKVWVYPRPLEGI